MADPGAVVVGMAVGAGQLMVAVCGLLIVGSAAALFRDQPQRLRGFDRNSLLTVRLSWSPTLESQLLEVVAKHAAEIQPRSVSTIRHGAAIELRYRVRFLAQSSPTELVTELNRLEGIQGVELDSEQREPVWSS